MSIQPVSEATAQKLKKEIPRILGLKAMGLSIPEIAEKIGVSAIQLKRYCRLNPDLQDVCACLTYRREYVTAAIMQDFKDNKLTERGRLKFLEILNYNEILQLKKKLLEIEVSLKEKGDIPEESRLEIFGISEDGLTRTMVGMTKRGQEAKGRYERMPADRDNYKPEYQGEKTDIRGMIDQ